jgi:PhzF family phenazine biosynthesis protein
MKTRPFKQVDVFTAAPYFGNPLAVVLDGSGLNTEQMQRFAHWTNLSETTFLLPPVNAAADYAVRIFTPTFELPFAGHPTLGSCHAWLQAGGQAKKEMIVQECGVGLVRIKREVIAGQQRLAFAAPPLIRGGRLPEENIAHIARGLGLPRDAVLHAAWCDNGPQWQAVMLRSAADVLAAKPDAALLNDIEFGLVGAHSPGSACAFEVRAFFRGASGLTEDPVTGSLNAALAQWLMDAGLAPDQYIAAQGTALGRAGRVYLQRDGADIWVGGEVVTCVEGSVKI